MYQKPDFVKVTIDSENAFANSSCPGDYSGQYMWTGEGCKDYYDPNSLVSGTATWQCYSEQNP